MINMFTNNEVEDTIVLESVNLLVNEEGMTFPINSDGSIDVINNEATHISCVRDLETHLTNEDLSLMLDFLYQFEDSDFMLNYLDWSQTLVGIVRNNNSVVDGLMSHLLAGGSI